MQTGRITTGKNEENIIMKTLRISVDIKFLKPLLRETIRRSNPAHKVTLKELVEIALLHEGIKPRKYGKNRLGKSK